MHRLLLSLLLVPSAVRAAEPDLFAQHTNRVVRFENHGTLAGWRGANVAAKVTESTTEDHDGNGRSLRCDMVRAEPDTPRGGCHAEMHLDVFPDGAPLGRNPGFTLFTSHWIKFDTNCTEMDIGFWQLKNHEGPKRWQYLVALWREARGEGDEIVFETNVEGPDFNLYGRLTRDGAAPLVPGRWHQVEVAGHFTSSTNGWVQVRLNGTPMTWYRDRDRRERVGTVVRGASLPDLNGAGWQFQAGGYGFFKRQPVPAGTVWADHFRIETLR